MTAFVSGTDADCKEWDDAHNVEYPSIGGNAGGSQISNDFGVTGWPTVILIAPDKKIVEKDIYPTSAIEKILQNYDIGNTKIAQSVFSIPNTPHLSLKAVTAQHLTLSIPRTGNYELVLFSADGKMLNTVSTGLLPQGEHIIYWDKNNFSHGVYFIRASSGNLKATKKIVLP